MKRKYQVNDNFFKEINSEEKAYLLGFFLADGSYCLGRKCTKSYKFSIMLQKEDDNVIKLFKDNIIPDKQIQYKEAYIDKNNVKHKSTAFISWTSHIMNFDLEKFNIYPKKTYDIHFNFPFEKIPNEYLWDFIRGFFDGDGQISYSDITKQSTFALYGTSEQFLSKLGDIFEKEFDVIKRVEPVKKSKMILYTLRFHAGNNRKLFFYKLFIKFYKNKKYYLFRKCNKFLHYLLFKYRDNPEYYERILDIVERRE